MTKVKQDVPMEMAISAMRCTKLVVPSMGSTAVHSKGVLEKGCVGRRATDRVVGATRTRGLSAPTEIGNIFGCGRAINTPIHVGALERE